MKVFSNKAAQSVDRRTQDEYGIGGFELMLAAGRAIARRIVSEYVGVTRWCVVCGKGNNGGDGLVVAAVLASEYSDSSYVADVVLMCSPSDLNGEAAHAWEFLQSVLRNDVACRLHVHDRSQLRSCLSQSAGIVDALFGVGLSRSVDGEWGDAVDAINDRKHRSAIVSVDVPSGVGDAVSGVCAVCADLTVCIGAPKRCLFSMPNALCAGRIVIEPIQFPRVLLDDEQVDENWCDWDEAKSWFAPRSADSNKGSYGRLLCVCGSAPFAGAAIFCATAAHRVGTGLVYIATPRDLNAIYKTALPESCTVIAPSADGDFLDGQSSETLLRALSKMSSVVIGPGVGCGGGQQQLVRSLTENVLSYDSLGIVLDADALNCLAAASIPFRAANGDRCVLTPHPGEAARLLHTSIDAVQSDRVGVARTLAAQYHATVLLKGACTVIARCDGQVWLDNYASAVLARGGSGDVLSGLIGGLLAQGLPGWQAAVLGSKLLSRAGDACALRMHERGVMIRDLLSALPFILDEGKSSLAQI